jgi:hypothetical protein
MPNLAVHFEVLNQVIAKLQAASDPRAAKLTANIKFAVLGALGPDLLRYNPISQQLSTNLITLLQNPALLSPPAATPADPNPTQTLVLTTLGLAGLEELQANPLGAIYSIVFSQIVVPLWPTINSITSFLSALNTVVQGQDQLGLIPFASKISSIQSQANSLKNNVSVIKQVTATVGIILALPPWMEQSQVTLPAPSDPTADRLFEFLRWHHTSKFANTLMENAATDEELAYAIGYLVHLATSVTAEPFINNVVGGPYRTHWWRNRLVGNFIDSWTFGFFETPASPMTGDNPTPPYAAWKALCTANLQEQLNVAGFSEPTGGNVPDALKAIATGNLAGLPGQVPASLAQYFQTAVDTIYPSAARPAGFSAATFQNSVVGAFAVFWFMTSGSGPLGVNTIGAPPSTCTTAPSWITSGGSPSPQQAGVNVPGAVCAAVLAILALLELLFGDLPGGLATLAAAINSPIIDWATVNCNLFWITKSLIDAENALQSALVTGGLAYPPPAMLGNITPDTTNLLQTTPAVDTTGVPFCKTNTRSGGIGTVNADTTYPRQLDASNQAADLNFNSYPGTRAELPATMNFPTPDVYPDFVVNGSGLQNGGILGGAVYPSRDKFFGDAVSNAMDLLKNGLASLPSYNLDADRGYGWLTWNPQPGSDPDAPPVLDVQE